MASVFDRPCYVFVLKQVQASVCSEFGQVCFDGFCLRLDRLEQVERQS